MSDTTPSGNKDKFFGQKVSKPGTSVHTASDNELVYKNDFTTTTYYDNNNSRILLGQLPDSSYGMWVSKPGVNVADITSGTPGLLNNLIFNSNQDIFKIVKTIDIAAPSGTFGSAQAGKTALFVQTNSVPHGLGFTPAFLAFIVINDPTIFNAIGQFYPLPITNWAISVTDNIGYVTTEWMVRVDNTNVTFEVRDFISAIGSAQGLTSIVLPATARVFFIQETVAM